MDRQTDLTIEALVARETDKREGLDHFIRDNTPKDGFSIVGIARRSEFMSELLGGIAVLDGPDDRIDFETFRCWLSSFGYPHPNHVRVDPYSFMWGNDQDCDCCGCVMHALNRPDPCYGICENCDGEIALSEGWRVSGLARG